MFGRECIALMLYFIYNGHVVIKESKRREFRKICQYFGVIGFMSRRTLAWHRLYADQVLFGEMVNISSRASEKTALFLSFYIIVCPIIVRHTFFS
jgi:hypothetical protein